MKDMPKIKTRRKKTRDKMKRGALKAELTKAPLIFRGFLSFVLSRLICLSGKTGTAQTIFPLVSLSFYFFGTNKPE